MRRALRVSLVLVAGCAPASVTALTDASVAADAGAVTDAPTASANDVPAPRDRPQGDDGALGPPAEVAVEVRTSGSCDALTACGGDVQGTWDVAGVCIEVPIDDTVMRCPGARITHRTGRASGRVVFGAGVARRQAQWSAQVEVFIPALCAGFVGGCAGIQSAVRAVVPDTTCATEGAGDCRCAARQAGALDDTDGYSTEGGQIVSATLRRRWDYCITGAQLRYRDASAMGPREPGTITLSRR